MTESNQLEEWPDAAMLAALGVLQEVVSGPVHVVDIGAHMGETLNIVRRHSSFEHIHYYAVEANPNTFSALEKSVGEISDPHIQAICVNAAAGPSPGRISFNSTQASAVAGVLAPIEGLNERVPSGDHIIQEVIEVPMITVDSIYTQFPKIDLLKVDAEGFDLEVLKGAASALQAGKIPVVLTEFFCVSYRDKQAYFWDIASYLKELGYLFVNLYDTRNTSQGRLYTGNGLWVSPVAGKMLNYL